MKTKLFLLAIISLILFSCDPADKFYNAKKPMVVVAIGKLGGVTVVDSNNEYITIPSYYYLAQTLSNSYNVGDTILFIK